VGKPSTSIRDKEFSLVTPEKIKEKKKRGFPIKDFGNDR